MMNLTDGLKLAVALALAFIQLYPGLAHMADSQQIIRIWLLPVALAACAFPITSINMLALKFSTVLCQANMLFWQMMKPGLLLVFSLCAMLALSPLAMAQTDGELLVEGKTTTRHTYAAGQLATESHVGLLGNQSLMETPFNTVSYTGKFISNRQAQDIGAVIGATDPAIYVSGKRNLQESFFIRGFSFSSYDISFNGLAGMAPYFRGSTEMAERIEVLKGPSVLLNGMSHDAGVGGSINLVPKRAPEKPLLNLTATYESKGLAGLHTDLGRRFGEANQFGIRFNGVYRDGNTAVDNQQHKMALVSFGLDLRKSRFRLSADIYKQREQLRGNDYAGIFAVTADVTQLPVPKKGNYPLAPQWAYVTNHSQVVMLRGDVNITDTTNAYAAWGYSKDSFDSVGASKILLNNAGDLMYSRQTVPAVSYEKISSGEAGLKGYFTTGPVAHDWSVTANRYRLTGNHIRGPSVNAVTNYYHMDYGSAPRVNSVPAFRSTLTLTSYAIADTLYFAGDRIQWMAGVRQQNIKTDKYDASRFSPGTALLLRITDKISVYGNYLEGLSKGGTAPVYAVNSGEVLRPWQSRQYEAGIKLDTNNVTSTFSLFRITQPNAYVDPVTNRYAVNGGQRNRGVEWSFFAEPVTGWRFIGGASYIQAVLTEALNTASTGKQVTGVPEVLMKLNSEYDVDAIPGLTLTGNMNYVSKRYATDDHRLSLPSYTIVDFGVRYATKIATTPVTVQGIVQNVTNKAYWMGSRASGGSALSGGLGAPRTFMLFTSVEF